MLGPNEIADSHSIEEFTSQGSMSGFLKLTLAPKKFEHHLKDEFH